MVVMHSMILSQRYCKPEMVLKNVRFKVTHNLKKHTHTHMFEHYSNTIPMFGLANDVPFYGLQKWMVSPPFVGRWKKLWRGAPMTTSAVW